MPTRAPLYPALQRLEHRGDIDSEWRSTENNRRARYYTITRQGRRALGEEVDRWHRFAAAIGAGAGGPPVSRLKGLWLPGFGTSSAERRRGLAWRRSSASIWRWSRRA